MATPKNRLSMRNVRAVPNQMPSSGGGITVQFEARTTVQSATATAAYAIAAGFPYAVTGGGSANPFVTTTEATVSNGVTIASLQQGTVSFVQLDVTASVPGDVPQTLSCFVWIDDPIGAHLKSYRQGHGLKQKDLAQLLGTSPGAISAIEHGRFPSALLEGRIVEELRNA